MDAPYEGSSDVYVLPTNITIPGVGVLPINAFLLMAEEPVLVDTGLGMDSPAFIDAVSSIVPFEEIKWVWLTHDDADHTGSIQQVMELAANARLVTQGPVRDADEFLVAGPAAPGARDPGRRRPARR